MLPSTSSPNSMGGAPELHHAFLPFPPKLPPSLRPQTDRNYPQMPYSEAHRSAPLDKGEPPVPQHPKHEHHKGVSEPPPKPHTPQAVPLSPTPSHLTKRFPSSPEPPRIPHQTQIISNSERSPSFPPAPSPPNSQSGPRAPPPQHSRVTERSPSSQRGP